MSDATNLHTESIIHPQTQQKNIFFVHYSSRICLCECKGVSEVLQEFFVLNYFFPRKILYIKKKYFAFCIHLYGLRGCIWYFSANIFEYKIIF